MPKIPPRDEIREHPLYQATMAAQHLAYQLMRDVPRDQKAAATRLHVACVHATTYAQYALDPEAEGRASQLEGIKASVSDARERLEALLPFFSDSRDAETLGEHLVDIEAKADGALAPAQQPAA